VTLFCECFSTNITGVRTLATMYTLVSRNIRLLTERIWTLANMFMLMCLYVILVI